MVMFECNLISMHYSASINTFVLYIVLAEKVPLNR
jgi:hypothetical protein